MDDNVYAVTEVVGSSASKTLRNVEWFEVSGTRGHVVDGVVAHYQVYVRLGFRYDKS